MFEAGVDLKLVFGALAALANIVAYVPYIMSLRAGVARPHVYTWLIWTLTTGTAAAGSWYGGGGYGALSATVAAMLTFILFVLSFKYGTKNITASDTIVLMFALFAIVVWWQLKQPLLSIIMVTLIDLSGYIPTYRKSWSEPWSESIVPWLLWVLYGFFLVLALGSYNPFTLVFTLATAIIANTILIVILLFRRRLSPKSVLQAPK